MFKRFLSIMLVLHNVTLSVAQEIDSTRVVTIADVVVVGNAQQHVIKQNALSVDMVDEEEFAKLFSGNLMKSLESLPGVQSMSVGAGFSKPMIRGMAFNRVVVTENGVKQEGQQWGVDHGLEIDAFNIEKVNIIKGPSSLLYGSDAMGGVVEILPPTVPFENQLFGSVDLLGRSANDLLGASLMLGGRYNNWFAKLRYSEQHFADLKVPTDTIVYLTQKLPLSNGQLNNTAGRERGANLYLRYGKGRFSSALSVSNTYQKMGFFAAAHGVPDPSKVIDDGDARDIDLPYSFVNHLKTILTTKYFWDNLSLTWDLGYQNNHREEWSAFHSHYGTQTPPIIDPDRELAFMLDTYSSGAKAKLRHSSAFESTISWDVQYQRNEIAGYSFLLPTYERLTSGLAWLATYAPTQTLSVSGGLRYDVGRINSEEYIDEHLASYLAGMGYDDETIESYKVRSYDIDRNFGDYSLSLGAVLSIDERQSVRANIGRSFRLPSVNELAANGVHHGSFRHEQGDPSLASEQGWQMDAAYRYDGEGFSASFSPFASWYQNYIYLRPSGEWSVLPHAGQTYRYSQSEALFAGAEFSASIRLPLNLRYDIGAEYIYTYNVDEATPLPFSPPASANSTLWWERKNVRLAASWKFVADQNRVSRNENATDGANLFGATAEIAIPSIAEGASIRLNIENIFNTRYLNHLSFYRQVEVPEAGRNIQLSIKIPFTLKHKNKK